MVVGQGAENVTLKIGTLENVMESLVLYG